MVQQQQRNERDKSMRIERESNPTVPLADRIAAWPRVKRESVKPSVVVWNTGRTYTAHGQRMAAVPMDGGVFMVDVDRNIKGFLPGIECTRSAVMNAYDLGEPRMEYVAPSHDVNAPGLTSEQRDARISRRRKLEERMKFIALPVVA